METQGQNSLKGLIKFKNFMAISFLLFSAFALGQKTYDDFEGNSTVCYNIKKGGSIDTTASNPSPDKVNASAKCAMYTRGKQRYDNIKMCTKTKLADVPSYATYLGQPAKIKMKVYTDAPVGTLVEIHLQKKAGNAYPEGTYAQFQAYTTKSGAWEELEFKFAETPKGSQTSAEEIEQVTLLFAPNTTDKVTFYFDEVTGPGFSTNNATVTKDQGTK
ncbi:MAG: putative beta,3-glucanase [Bacteroidetes bacterium]|jgi:hypothetical protein|nr:putative beta,3-glucanase [Bacteroidota bacterium]